MIALAGLAVSGYMVVRTDVKSLASQTSGPGKLAKVTQTPLAQSTAENIVDIQPVIDKWVSEHPDQNWGIVIKSLEGPSFNAAFNPDRQFGSASIYKLFLVKPLFDQIPLEHQQKITVSVNGQPRAISTCLDLMLRLSHNECGEAVGKYLNWSKAQQTLNKAGYASTEFKVSELSTTAADTARFLEQLNGDMLNRNAKENVLKSLREQRWREGIPAGCPGCTTATKTGSSNGFVHDVGIVRYQSGSYVLSIFSEDGSFKQIAELTGRIHQHILDTTTN